MPSQDELLRKIAAAAIPRRLGRVFSRYGEPAPVLGRERPSAPHAPGAAGRPGSSQQSRDFSEPSEEEEKAREAMADMAAKFEEPHDTQSESAARAEQSGGDEGMAPESRDTLVSAYGATTPGLEDLLDSDPSLTPSDVQLFVRDHAKGGIGWEDWLDQRKAETSGPDQ
jgi:hypothetical protein